MPVLGSFGGGRGFGRGGLLRLLPPTIQTVSDVGFDRAFDDGALTITVVPNTSGPVPTSYRYWAVASDTTQTSAETSSSTTFELDGLKSGTFYTVKVIAVLGAQESQEATASSATEVTTIPAVATSVAGNDVGVGRAVNNASAIITFTPGRASGKPETYAVYTGNTLLGSGFSSPITLTEVDISSVSSYSFRIQVLNGNGESAFSTESSPVTLTAVPNAPTSVSATDAGTNRSITDAAASVSFTPGNSGGKTQTFKVYTSDGVERGSGSSSPITATGIDTSSNSSYAFNVRAFNDNGQSELSSNSSTISLTTIPAAPTLTVNSTSGTTVNFSFNVPVTGGKAITSTRVFIMSGDGSELATTTIAAASGTGSLVIPELTNNDAFLRGEATNANGTGAVGSAGTIIQRSGTPTLSVSRPNMQNATVTITNYNASFAYSFTTASGTATRSGSTITITGTTAGAFDVTVTMNQGAFFINRSAVVTVPASTTAGPVTGISVTDFGGGIIQISWAAIAGAVSYRFALSGQGGSTEIITGTEISYDGLNPGSSYSVVISAFSGANAGGTLLASGSLEFSPEAAPSPPPPPPPPSDPPPSDPPPSDPPPSDPPPSDPPAPPAPTCSGTCKATGGISSSCSSTETCTPSGCPAGCTVTCTTTCATGSPGQSVTVTGSCGSQTNTIPYPGAQVFIRCCSC